MGDDMHGDEDGECSQLNEFVVGPDRRAKIEFTALRSYRRLWRLAGVEFYWRDNRFLGYYVL